MYLTRVPRIPYSTMVNTQASLPTLEDLRSYVLDSLCAHDLLDPEQTELHEAVIVRSGRSCGLFFQAHGPRLLKTYAVWTGADRRIIFYDSKGSRIAATVLDQSPEPPSLAA